MRPTAARMAAATSWRSRRVPLTPRDGCCLGTLLASHISSRQRLEYLRQALQSIGSQAVPPDVLVVSWYAEEPLAGEVATALRTVRLPLRLRSLRQRRRLSQYGHLREALAAFELEAPRDAAGAAASWLLFSDDDDLWHPQRGRLARLACAQASAEPPLAAGEPRTRALAFGIYAYPVEAAAQEAKTTAHVDQALDARKAAIWLGASEVFQYAVRPALLRTFLRAESEAVLSHRFADVRFATWMRQVHRAAVRELGADELMRLDRGERGWRSRDDDEGGGLASANGGGGAKVGKPHERDAQAWMARHWLYFYRNTRQLSAVEWMGNLDDLNAHHLELSHSPHETAATATAAGSEYERASTGLQPPHEADRLAARRVLGRLGESPSQAVARREEEELTAEIGRLRHHAELTAMMCMGFRNAQALAVAVIGQASSGSSGDGQPTGSQGRALAAALQHEQNQLVCAALEAFGHSSRRAELPVGTVEECLA